MECTLKNASLFYEEYGEGKPVIIIHGYYPDHRLMSGCMEPVFAGKTGYRRIYPDLPGMGKTKGEAWINSSDRMLEVVLEFIDAIIPGQNFLLAGESYGGYLARGIIYHMADRVDGLLLLCPAIAAEYSKRDLPSKTVLVRDEALLSGLNRKDAEDFENMAVIQSEEIWRRYRDEILSGVRIADVVFLEKLREQYAYTYDVDALKNRFEKPSVFILGRQDASVGYKGAWKILNNYPRATFAVLDGAGHNLQLEQAEVFSCLVNDWLSRADKADK